jgi:thiosulfate dehydrogenase [quinone] large subunit
MTITGPTTHTTTGRPVLRTDDVFLATPIHEETPRHTAYRFTLALTRISLGWVFLWAFLDKLFGLGHETASKAAWLNGGSPTSGFLAHSPQGPFTGFYNGIAGSALADWLFMAGLASIGTALILGIGMRIAAGAGAALMVMMFSAVLPPANNVIMDDHLIYALVLVALALTSAGHTLGLGRLWGRMPLVQKFGFLK